VVGAFALMGASYFLVRFIFKRRRSDQAPEGRPTTIIEGRRIRQDRLAKELLTESELLTVAASAKGFSSLEEIESRELEPGGGFIQQPAELRRRT
jgi:uncharacterized membrane protein YcaP (DUF421 family)